MCLTQWDSEIFGVYDGWWPGVCVSGFGGASSLGVHISRSLGILHSRGFWLWGIGYQVLLVQGFGAVSGQGVRSIIERQQRLENLVSMHFRKYQKSGIF